MLQENPRSTAKVAGHPIHPMLIPFPLAFLFATLASDLIFWISGNSFWASASFYLLAAGIATALVAAVAGFTDFLGDRRIRALSHAWQHMVGNLLAVGIAGLNLMLRTADPAEAIIPAGLFLSATVALILVFTGWRGGELVFHHRVGIADRGE